MGRSSAMDSQLPQTGTAEFLDGISPHVPDDFINDLLPPHRGPGQRCRFSAGQLWRVHLLSVLTPVHAFNLLVQMLPEQKAWRHFAHLPNRHAVPEAWMLHQFRQRAGVRGLRRINEHLLQPLLPLRGSTRMSVALIDATDLEAACSGHKKTNWKMVGPGSGDRSPHAQDRPKQILPRRQEAHLASLALTISDGGLAGSAGQLDRSGQSLGRRFFAPEHRTWSEPLALAPRPCRGGHGLHRCRQQAANSGTLAEGCRHAPEGEHELGQSL